MLLKFPRLHIRCCGNRFVTLKQISSILFKEPNCVLLQTKDFDYESVT